MKQSFEDWKAALFADGVRRDDGAVEDVPEFILWEAYDWGVEPTIEALKERLKRQAE